MELSLTSPPTQSRLISAHVCSRSSIAPVFLQLRRANNPDASLVYHSEFLSQKRFPICSTTRVKAGESASASVQEDESKVPLGGEEGDAETDEEYNRKLQEDLKQKADKILKDAINNFVQSDIEDASEKYDMEEELFAEIDFAQINAFADQPFAGNPAAVCYLPLKRSDEWMQLVAREFNLSETAFLMKRNTKKKKSFVFKKSAEEEQAEQNAVSLDEFDLRWFTPKVEVNLCGHATLASAHLLFTSGIAESETIIFHTKSGLLKATKIWGYDKPKSAKKEDISDEQRPDDSKDLEIEKTRPIGVGVAELDFPLVSYAKCDDEEAKSVSAALGGMELLWVGKTNGGDYLAEVSCSREIKQLQPDFSRMLELDARGIIVTALADKDSGFDFVSRFFAPKAGILEDPVTGSAHCALGPYWAERLGKTSLKAYQASERGGKLELRVDSDEGRVYLRGSAVLVMAGVLLNTMRTQGSS